MTISIDKEIYFNYTNPAPKAGSVRNSKKRSCYVKPLKKFYDLLIQVGFTDYNKRREIANHIYENHKYFWWAAKGEITENDGPAKVLESFLNDKEIIKNRTRISSVKDSNKISASEIGDFTFCPASLSIKRTFELPPTDHMELGSELHEERHMEIFLSRLYDKRKRECFPNAKPVYLAGLVRGGPINDWTISGKSINDIDEKDLSTKQKNKIYKGSWGELLKSNIIFKGHDYKKTKIFFSNQRNLNGVPDYILKNPNEDIIIVEEKHTWHEVVNNPFENHIMQLIAYLNLNYDNNTRSDKGYLTYFSWDWLYLRSGEKVKTTKNARIHKIINDKANKIKLRKKFLEMQSFIDSGEMNFNNNEISTLKCFNCSSRALCKHKNSNLNKLKFPYL
jgi:hypothetical protein